MSLGLLDEGLGFRGGCLALAWGLLGRPCHATRHRVSGFSDKPEPIALIRASCEPYTDAPTS